MKKKIFIVTEDLRELNLLCEVIRQLDNGMKVMSIFGLKELLKLVDCMSIQPPDLLLLNVQVPASRVVHAVSRLQDDRRYRQVPKVVVSGDRAVTTVDDCLNMGISDYVVIPENASVLKSALRNILQNHRVYK